MKKYICPVKIVWVASVALCGCGGLDNTSVSETPGDARMIQLNHARGASAGDQDNALGFIEPENMDDNRAQARPTQTTGERAASPGIQDDGLDDDSAPRAANPSNDGDDHVSGAEQTSPGDLLDTCDALLSCLSACVDNSCEEDCRGRSSADVLHAVATVEACIEVNHCSDNACVERFCSTELRGCGFELDGDERRGPEAQEQDRFNRELSCTGVFDCFNQCPQGDRVCTDRCFEAGTADAQSLVSEVGDCVVLHGCDDDACVQRVCRAEVAACERGVGQDIEHEDFEPEVCFDGRDNDGDGLSDCDDRDCSEDAACAIDDGDAGVAVCDTATPLLFGENLGSTLNAPATSCGECVIPGLCAGRGGEQVLAFVADAQDTICIDTRGSDFDTVLYVRVDECAAQRAQLSCNDDHRGTQSQLEFDVDPGRTYFVFVDSYDAGGGFVLNARRGRCAD